MAAEDDDADLPERARSGSAGSDSSRGRSPFKLKNGGSKSGSNNSLADSISNQILDMSQDIESTTAELAAALDREIQAMEDEEERELEPSAGARSAVIDISSDEDDEFTDAELEEAMEMFRGDERQEEKAGAYLSEQIELRKQRRRVAELEGYGLSYIEATLKRDLIIYVSRCVPVSHCVYHCLTARLGAAQ